ncbi:MAG: hypothetical protein GY868_19815, partial [Deltaproteobacteria bacterium]|nr:hypothetical protein [Deltaproteobacteria bacterium]
MLNTDAAARATTHTRAIQPELIKQTLELAAFPSEIVSLKHIPAFPQGLLIPEVQEQPILIGFPAQGLRPGNLFFLQAGKRSGLLQWDAARRSIIYYGSSNGTLPQ